jgi:ribonuclease E
LKRNTYENCPCCSGTGQVKTAETVAIDVMRLLMTAANIKGVSRVNVEIHERVANYLNNRKRREITALEERSSVAISVIVRLDVGPEHVIIRATDEIGNEVKNLALADS